jgi:hypothetical protein
MSTSITVLHVQDQGPLEVEQAVEAIFAREERPRVLRIEGTYSAVLERVSDTKLAAGYRYLILRAHLESRWTPLLELGNRTEGLDVELSRTLGGSAVFTAFVYGDAVSGYRLARGGALVDRYASDPTYFGESEADQGNEDSKDEEMSELVETPETPETPEMLELAGHPERFADLLPPGTTAEDFVRVVLRPGWWEEHASAEGYAGDAGGGNAGDTEGGRDAGSPMEQENGERDGEREELVDEADRMRCIGLALELWGPADYPFAQDPEEIPNRIAGPAVALAFA